MSFSGNRRQHKKLLHSYDKGYEATKEKARFSYFNKELKNCDIKKKKLTGEHGSNQLA
jgi:hypothetical protein